MTTAKKWNGKSLYQLGVKRQRLDGIQIALSELSRLKSEAEEALLAELGRLLDRHPNVLQEGPWSCTESPTRHCLYDMSSDERDDECLFCQEPLERK